VCWQLQHTTLPSGGKVRDAVGQVMLPAEGPQESDSCAEHLQQEDGKQPTWIIDMNDIHSSA